jgi:hypothetical protein
MAGWATLWLGGIATLAVLLTLVARTLIPFLARGPRGCGDTRAVGGVERCAPDGAVEPRCARSTTVLSLKDRDFSMSVTETTRDELGELVSNYNGLGDRLRVERQSLYQRELMLDSVIQTTPLALVLTNSADAVVYSNSSARRLFAEGRKLEGDRFSRYLEQAAAPLREAIDRGGDTLFTLEIGRSRVTTCRNAAFCSTRSHRLLLLKQLTRHQFAGGRDLEKVIRVIAHELNNSWADFLTGPFGADPRQHPARSRTAQPDLLHHRGSCAAPCGVHRGLCAIRKVAEAAAGAGFLAGAHRAAASGREF